MPATVSEIGSTRRPHNAGEAPAGRHRAKPRSQRYSERLEYDWPSRESPVFLRTAGGSNPPRSRPIRNIAVVSGAPVREGMPLLEYLRMPASDGLGDSEHPPTPQRRRGRIFLETALGRQTAVPKEQREGLFRLVIGIILEKRRPCLEPKLFSGVSPVNPHDALSLEPPDAKSHHPQYTVTPNLQYSLHIIQLL